MKNLNVCIAATWALRREVILLWTESRWAGSQTGKLGTRWRARGNENIGEMSMVVKWQRCHVPQVQDEQYHRCGCLYVCQSLTTRDTSSVHGLVFCVLCGQGDWCLWWHFCWIISGRANLHVFTSCNVIRMFWTWLCSETSCTKSQAWYSCTEFLGHAQTERQHHLFVSILVSLSFCFSVSDPLSVRVVVLYSFHLVAFSLSLISCYCLLTFTQTAFSWFSAFNILLCWLHTEGDSPWFVSISQINFQLHLECVHSWSTLFSFGKSYDVCICLWICIGELGTKVCLWGVCIPCMYTTWLFIMITHGVFV